MGKPIGIGVCIIFLYKICIYWNHSWRSWQLLGTGVLLTNISTKLMPAIVASQLEVVWEPGYLTQPSAFDMLATAPRILR